MIICTEHVIFHAGFPMQFMHSTDCHKRTNVNVRLAVSELLSNSEQTTKVHHQLSFVISVHCTCIMHAT